MKRMNWMKWTALIAMTALWLVCCTCALADARLADMGIGSVTPGSSGIETYTVNKGEVISQFGSERELGFEVEKTNASYSVSIQTAEKGGWYILSINNRSVAPANARGVAGLYVWMMDEAHQPVLANVQAPVGITTIGVRLNAYSQYELSFLACNNVSGMVAFSLEHREDLGGERLETAADVPAGVTHSESISVQMDQDWFFVPAAEEVNKVYLRVENELEEALEIVLYDEVGSEVESQRCAPGRSAELIRARVPETTYYVRIKTKKGLATGAYRYAWCDGEHHVFEERKARSNDPFSKKCELCGGKLDN